MAAQKAITATWNFTYQFSVLMNFLWTTYKSLHIVSDLWLATTEANDWMLFWWVTWTFIQKTIHWPLLQVSQESGQAGRLSSESRDPPQMTFRHPVLIIIRLCRPESSEGCSVSWSLGHGEPFPELTLSFVFLSCSRNKVYIGFIKKNDEMKWHSFTFYSNLQSKKELPRAGADILAACADSFCS